jgi:hypothetical protein
MDRETIKATVKNFILNEFLAGEAIHLGTFAVL